MVVMFTETDFAHCYTVARSSHKNSFEKLDRVYFVKKGDKMYMLALDGHSMPVYLKNLGSEEAKKEDFVYTVHYSITSDAIVKTLKKGFVFVDTDNMKIDFGSVPYTEKLIDDCNDFDIDSIIKRVTECVKSEKFAPAKDMGKFNLNMFEFVITNKKKDYNIFSCGDNSPMIIVDNSRSDYIGIVMPIRQSEEDTVNEENKIRFFFGIELKDIPGFE